MLSGNARFRAYVLGRKHHSHVLSERFSVNEVDMSCLNEEGVKAMWNTAAGFIGEDMPRKPLDAFVVIHAQARGGEVLPRLPQPRKRETPGCRRRFSC